MENNKIRVWMAPEDVESETDLGNSIKNAVEETNIFVLIYTAKSMNSNLVKAQFELAKKKEEDKKKKNKKYKKGEDSKIIIFKSEDVEFPADQQDLIRKVINFKLEDPKPSDASTDKKNKIISAEPILDLVVAIEEILLQDSEKDSKASKAEISKSNEFFWKWRRTIGFLIIVGGIILTLVISIDKSQAPLSKLGIVGIGTFLSMLLGSFLITDEWNFNKGEFRKAITVSIVVVYFFTMAYGNQIIPLNDTWTNNTFTGNLTLSEGSIVTLANGTNVSLANATSGTFTNTTTINNNTNITSQLISAKVDILNGVFSNFWIIVLLVIGAYFGERAYEIKKEGEYRIKQVEKAEELDEEDKV